MKTVFNRREFIKKSIIAGSAIYLSSVEACSGNSKKYALKSPSNSSRVIIARSNLVRNSDNTLNPSSVFNLLNNALENLYEINPAKKIWSKLFSPGDTVGIKLNCLAGRGLSSSQELVDAIIENLLSIGIKKGRIIVWDRANKDLEKAGYRIQTSPRNIRYYGNDYAGYTNQLYESCSIGSLLSNILVHQCTAIINVPILKDHGIVGMTNALKNFFGAIHNPNKYHTNNGDPYIADVNLLPEIRNKVRLTIGDALTAQYEGGPPYMPQWTWLYNGILLGTDMVAIDTIGWRIIEEKRAEKGFPSLKVAGREPTYIATAADVKHRLGTNDWKRIEAVEI